MAPIVIAVQHQPRAATLMYLLREGFLDELPTAETIVDWCSGGLPAPPVWFYVFNTPCMSYLPVLPLFIYVSSTARLPNVSAAKHYQQPIRQWWRDSKHREER